MIGQVVKTARPTSAGEMNNKPVANALTCFRFKSGMRCLLIAAIEFPRQKFT
jgi:hypothetical protein